MKWQCTLWYQIKKQCLLLEVHINSDLLKAICWLFDALNHSSMECSLAALWAI